MQVLHWLTILALSYSHSVYAGSSLGPVTTVIVNSSNYLFFEAGAIAGKANCATAGNQWALNISTATGKSIYALILFAKNTGRQVLVAGNGTCNNWGDREDVLYASIPE